MQTPVGSFGIIRSVFVPEDIMETFEGRRAHTGFPDFRARIRIGVFSAGHYISISLSGDPDKRAPDIERLIDVDEVWVMCFRSPRPGWRLFGRFVAKNIFVGSLLKDRHGCGGRRQYTSIAESVVSAWDADYAQLPIIRGTTWQDYLDGTVKDVDSH